MSEGTISLTTQKLETPRAAALAGILFTLRDSFLRGTSDAGAR
jgi:hypothetical protein